MKPTFRIIIAGSRSFEDIELMRVKCDAILANKMDTHNIVIVSGTAGGADKTGERYAEERGFKVQRYPAQWDLLGKRAGYVRNQLMMDNADAAIVFWDGASKGSRHMIDIAEAAGAPLRVIIFKPSLKENKAIYDEQQAHAWPTTQSTTKASSQEEKNSEMH